MRSASSCARIIFQVQMTGRLEPEFHTSRPRVSGPGANSSRSSIRSRRREGHVPCGSVGAARDEGPWAEKGERTPTRLSYHSGYYGRMLVTCVSNFGAPGAARYRLGWMPEHSRRRARQSRSSRRLWRPPTLPRPEAHASVPLCCPMASRRR